MAKLSTLAKGTKFLFGNREWILLDPITGLICSSTLTGLLKFDTVNTTTTTISEVSSTNIGYMLKTTYYDSLSEQEKAVVIRNAWGVGPLNMAEGGYGNTTPGGSIPNLKSKEVAKTVSLYVSFLSLSEYAENKSLLRDNVIIGLRNPLINNDGGLTSYLWRWNEGSYHYMAATQTRYVYATMRLNTEANVVDGKVVFNNEPIISLSSPTNNQTLYENDVFNITGTASDADNGNTVTVRYQINALTTRAIKAFLSDGSTLESFSKSLTFKGGNLYDGTTLIAENLSDGVSHTLKVWATDDQGGTSAIREIPFYVVPNRAPLLTVNAPVISGNINSDKFKVNGTFEDSDGNNTIVSYRLNGASSVQVAEGVNGTFEFELVFGQLVIGANEIVIEAVDSYGAKVSKTVKLNKAAVETPLLKSTARYKINPPTGSAQAVLLWIQRDEQLDIDVSLNMTMVGEAESFVALTASNTAPLDQVTSVVEDEFYHEAGSAKDNIIVQIDMTRSSVEVSDAIHLISGVLE